VGRVLASVERVGVQVMVRARGGDFVYNDHERAVMIEDVMAIKDLAASAGVAVGVVTGALTSDAAVDEPLMAELIAVAHPLPVTFHKAIDAAADIDAAYAALTRLGVERVLSSGGRTTAVDGADALARWSGDPSGPAVLAGGGVRAHNIGALVDATGVSEVHLRAQSPSPRADGTLVTDGAIVRAAVAAARGASARS
jgi:copper homeostasis protein CutC